MHKRFTTEHVKYVFQQYERKEILRKQACEKLEIGKTRFSELYKSYKEDSENFSVTYIREKQTRKLETKMDELIALELRADKKLIENEKIETVTTYNFNAVRDEIRRKYKKEISSGTIRNRAISWGFWKPKNKSSKTYIEFEAGGFGVLWQHDASIHKWSPYMEKFYLILTIDDHSRYFVYGKFVQEESSIAHIYSIEEAVLSFGIPLQYYVDRHSIFTGYERKSVYQKQQKEAKEFEIQFGVVCNIIGIKLINAKTANAKGKIERPFRYLQDRLCRRMAKEEVRTMDHANRILQEEIEFYNCYKIHSITGQIPIDRVNQSMKNKTSAVRPFNTERFNVKDVFCLHHKRSVDKFHRISYDGFKIRLNHVQYMQKVHVNVRIDDKWKYLRIFANEKYIKNIMLPLKKKS